ncbi:MAG TPA: hypothetical protein VFQ40_07895 [Actinomycetota bacterium]|nr:hypothetical protein [Actinomycetota bacterium]
MNERTRRTSLIAGAIVLGLASIGAGALIAISDDGAERARPTGTPTASSSPSPSSAEEPSPTQEPSPSPARPVLEDGIHFVYVTDGARRDDGSIRVTFDLASFLTGEEGAQAAAAHGDEFVNDYYIVNDNPRLRTIPVAADATVRYLPAGGVTTELQPGDLDAWLDAVLGTNPTDYGGTDVPWWFAVRDGVVTRIEQPYLP